MSPEDNVTTNKSTETVRSGWDLINDLNELVDLPLPAFCQQLVERFVDTEEVLGCGIWRIEPVKQSGQATVSLVADDGILHSPLIKDPRLANDHQAWLRDVISNTAEHQQRWFLEEPPAFGPFVTNAARICLRGECLAILETVRYDHPADPASIFPELLEELARLIERRWQAVMKPLETPIATPPEPRVQTAASSTVSPTATPPVVKAVQAAPPSESVTTTSPQVTTPPTNGRVIPPAPRLVSAPVATNATAPPVAAVDPRIAAVLPQLLQAPVMSGATPIPVVKPTLGPAPAPPPNRYQELLELTGNLQKSLSSRTVADVAANDGRLWLGCDRVTVLTGRRPRITAVSGLARWSRRAPWVPLLERLAKVVCDGQQVLEFPQENLELPDQLERPLADYVAEAAPRAIIAIPLAVETQVSTDPDKPITKRRPIGCLVVEQLVTGETVADLPLRARQLAECLCRPLDNAAQCDSILFLPLWRSLGQFARWMRGRRLAWTTAAIALFAAIVTALVIVPWEYRVEAQGQYLPAHRRDVFVPIDSEVQEILVTSGQQVAAGDVVVRLKNEELEAELVAARSELDEKRKLYRALQSEIDQAQKTGQKDNELQLFGRLEETRVQIVGLTRKVSILNSRAEKLEVRSPVAGTVATFQVDQLLKYRPVQRGEVLLTIMDQSGPWQLELKVDENRLDHLIQAQTATQQHLPVEYVLVTAPDVHHTAELREVATRATMAEDDRLVVRLTADPTGTGPADYRIGAEVRARIGCGPKPLGYVLFGDVIEFVQRYVWW